ncbi:MAG: glycosyltransferase family 10 domain-containing protein [Candidatus Woesearchaeota archaeon]
MKKKVSVFTGNKLLDNNEIFNYKKRNNLTKVYLLKKELEKKGFDVATSDIIKPKESEIHLYFCMPFKMPKKKNISKSYIVLGEPKLVVPRNFEKKYYKYFNKIFTWKDSLVNNKKFFKINYSFKFPKKIIYKVPFEKKKNFTLIAGNKFSLSKLELYSKRLELIKWFEKNGKNGDFEFYGYGWNKGSQLISERFGFLNRGLKLFDFLRSKKFKNYKGSVDDKFKTLSKYKFNFAFENSIEEGYVTEKIFDSFFAGTVPIYLGTKNISKSIPKSCYIDYSEFNSIEEMYKTLKSMSKKEYNQYIKNIENYITSKKINKFRVETFVNTVVKNILN